MSTWSVVLAGGVGSRFWPLSTPARPKQLLPLIDGRPLLVGTLERLAPLTPTGRTLILTNASLTEATRALLPQVPVDNVIAEPRPAGTAAALTWAAAEIERRDGRDATMLSVHADWAIGDEGGFRDALSRAGSVAARHGALVTVGVVPSRPDPGFGYIRPGVVVDGDARRVAEFVEKPDPDRAAVMVTEGCLWNSGIFAWRVGDFLDEVRAHTPEVAPALVEAGDDREAFFAQVKSISVDVGVLERSSRVLVIPGDFGWDDIGTWAALRRVRALDGQQNAAYGHVHAVESTNNVVHAEHGAVVLFGVSDLVVVARDGLTLVTTLDRAAQLKSLIDALPPSIRELP
ncbi:MAG: sugar phosphate nucleotidyltransferase [Gemmatimonadaceae bacterium]